MMIAEKFWRCWPRRRSRPRKPTALLLHSAWMLAPIQLLRAGVKLTGLIPAVAREHMNEAMREQGVNFDVNQIRPENLDELIDQLNDLSVDVDQAQTNTKVRVFCE